MDTTYTSGTGNVDDIPKKQYVSCIKVDGMPILPPLMTDAKRIEMRRYRELAILKETQLKQKLATRTSVINPERKGNEHTTDAPATKVVQAKTRSPSTSPKSDDPVTSTPRMSASYYSSSGRRESSGNTARAILNFDELQNASGDSSARSTSLSANNTVVNTSDVPEGVLRERQIIVLPSDLNKTQSTDPSGPSSSAVSYDGDEDVGNVEVDVVESDENESTENFASAASSTGTFVVRRSDEVEVDNNPVENSGRKSKESTDTGHNILTSEDEENAPPTVVRKPSEDILFRRKRPAKFFDCDGPETPTSSSTANLPNSVPEEKDDTERSNSGTSSKFSPVPRTNFSSIAKSLTNEFNQKVYATLKSSSLTAGHPSTSSRTSGSYDVVLSREIPSSAEKANNEFDTMSNSSDKENINTLLDAGDSKKHIRKLSYTLAGPSAVLLEAVSQDKTFAQTLETVASAPSSAGIQSGQPTPEKSQQQNSTVVENNPKSSHTSLTAKQLHKQAASQDTLTANDPGLTSALANLNLGHGKQAHLARFLGDQEQVKDEEAHETQSSSFQEEHFELLIKRMEEEQYRKLRELAERHRQQELLLKKEFESDIQKLKEIKLSSSLNVSNSTKSNKISPKSRLDSANSSARSPTATATSALLSPEENTVASSKNITSGMSGISFSEQSKVGLGESAVYQFKGESRSASTTKQSGGSELAIGVGLSKLQSRMQLMSPSLFRIPSDAKSPLLKGLVFLDPLDKPRPPLRIPPKSLDPEMKPKFDKISAAVKGFLTRRILHTEKVQIIVQTIRDTVDLLMKLYEEAPMSDSAAAVKPQDHELHQRLIQQLTGACRSFHDVFFKLTTKERMAIIATDREKLKAKAQRLMNSPGRPNISNATLKSIERRMSHRASPKRDGRRQRNSKAYDPITLGSSSVTAKPIKSFNISPKRRRISYWDERNSNRQPYPLAKTDLNGNSSLKTPVNSARSHLSVTSSSSARSTRSYQVGSSVGIGDTFIVPSSTSSKSGMYLSTYGTEGRTFNLGSSAGRRDSTTSNSAKTISARSTQSTISSSSISNTRSSGRASISRQKPWK